MDGWMDGFVKKGLDLIFDDEESVGDEFYWLWFDLFILGFYFILGK